MVAMSKRRARRFKRVCRSAKGKLSDQASNVLRYGYPIGGSRESERDDTARCWAIVRQVVPMTDRLKGVHRGALRWRVGVVYWAACAAFDKHRDPADARDHWSKCWIREATGCDGHEYEFRDVPNWVRLRWDWAVAKVAELMPEVAKLESAVLW